MASVSRNRLELLLPSHIIARTTQLFHNCDLLRIMAQSRRLSPVELDAALRGGWVDDDIIDPAQNWRTSGRVADGGNGGVTPSFNGAWVPEVSQDSQLYHHNATRECLPFRPTLSIVDDTIGSPPYTSPISPTLSEASESLLRALDGLSTVADDGLPSPDLSVSSSYSSGGFFHPFTSSYVRDRQSSLDYPDADAPPPYTPTHHRSSFSPTTPSLTSDSLSAVDSPWSQYSLFSMSPLQPRNRSFSSVAIMSETPALADDSQHHIRKRSASSAGLASIQAANVGPGSPIRSPRQLPAVPPPFSLASPTEPEGEGFYVQGSMPNSHREEPVALFGKIRKAMNKLSDYVNSIGPTDRIKYHMVQERLDDVVQPLKMLLYATVLPIEEAWYDTVPDYVRGKCVPRYTPDRLRIAYWNVIGTLSRLVTTTIALQYDPNISVADSGLKQSLPALEATLRNFVKEVQRAQQDGYRSPSGTSGISVKSYRGSFLTPDAGPGTGSAGSWQGFGYSKDVKRLRELDSSVIGEMSSLVGLIERKLLGLVTSSSSASNKSDRIQSEGQVIAGQLSELLTLLGSLDVARYDDPSPYAHEGQLSERAHLIRTLEAATQALFDDSAVFLTTMQAEAFGSSGSRSDPLGVLVTAIMANLSLTISTLKTLVALSGDRQDVSSLLAMPGVAAITRAISVYSSGDGTLPTDPDSSIDRSMQEEVAEDVVDMELALFTRPPISIDTSLSSPRRRAATAAPSLHASRSSTGSVALSDDRITSSPPLRSVTPSRARHLQSPSTVTVDSDWTTTTSMDTSVSSHAESSVSKSPKRATKLFQILGREAPQHYIDNMNTDSIAWYLRPTYVQSEIRIEPTGEVTAGTRTALVERLTAHDHADPVFFKDFLMTFKSFMTVNELFEMLVERYWIPAPNRLTDEEMKDWKTKKQHVIRARVLNTLKSIVIDEDILERDDLHILEDIKQFIMAPEVIEVTAAKRIVPLIERLQSGSKAKVRTLHALATAPPTSIIPKTNDHRELKLLDVDPIEMARQLTLMEFKLYKDVRPSECLQRTREPTPDRNKDSIATLIRLNTQLVNFVVESILSKADARKRGQVIKHFILVADACRQYQNFSSLFAIVSALNKPEIRRLSKSKAQVSKRNWDLFEKCEELLDSKKNYHNYWTALEKLQPPCIPFFGRYLSTLTFINDGAKDNLSKGQMINFRKRQKAAGVIRDIKKWQSCPFNFQGVGVILGFLEESLKKYVEGRDYGDQWWRLSLEREPREQDVKERYNQLLRESGL